MVTKDLVILARIANEFGGSMLDSLETRIAFQKTVYLLQLSGLDIGYVFGWELYGPYSKSLAGNVRLYEESRCEVDKVAEQLVLTQWAQDMITRTRKFLSPPESPDVAPVKPSEWLEVLTSLHYLATLDYRNALLQEGSPAREHVTKCLLERKPHLQGSPNLVRQAWESLFSFLGGLPAAPCSAA
jgi:hypothetical protein